MFKIRETAALSFLSLIHISIGVSKCPQARKAHDTNCTIFYNCVNLPENGYVWLPAKCSEGLVFQPYLQTCVLSGDAWTCGNSSTTSQDRPEIMNTPETSNIEYQEIVSLGGKPSSSIDSSYLIKDHSEVGGFSSSMGSHTPITDEEESNSPIDKIEDKIVDNYLFRYFVGQQRLETKLASSSQNNGGLNNTWLRAVIDRILLYENVDRTTTACNSNDLSKPNNLHDIENEIVMKYLENLIFGRRTPARIKKKNRKTATREKNEKIKKEEGLKSSHFSTDKTTRTPGNDVKSEHDNIVVIEGNLGYREYITVEKYKLLSSHVDVKIVEVLPCAKGIRLPNRTDCAKYYTCDPETARVHYFSCSPKTAFNPYNRVCETDRYRICELENEDQTDTTTLGTGTFPESTEISHEPCRNTGKFVDADSENHYYVCYSSEEKPTKIQSLRMTCPNGLVFCQERRVCSTRKRCYNN